MANLEDLFNQSDKETKRSVLGTSTALVSTLSPKAAGRYIDRVSLGANIPPSVVVYKQQVNISGLVESPGGSPLVLDYLLAENDDQFITEDNIDLVA